MLFFRADYLLDGIGVFSFKSMSKIAYLFFPDKPEVVKQESEFPFYKSAKNGNHFYPMIATGNLLDFVVTDDNIVAATRKVKLNAFNPSGSEHGIVKKACDMLIDNPSFREIICRDLLRGIFYPERIAFDRVFKEKNMTLPRGFVYTTNMIVQTMIMPVIELSLAGAFSVPCVWSKMHGNNVNMMLENVDRIRTRGFKYWISLKLESFQDNIPHDRLMQGISFRFPDKKVANLVCTLLDLHTVSSNDSRSKCIGLPKDSPFTDMLSYNLYLPELDQEIMRLGLTHVRFNDEIVVFCANYAVAEQIKGTLVAFVKNVMKCPVDQNKTRIKKITHLEFLGLSLKRGQWRIQSGVKDRAVDDYLRHLFAYALRNDKSLLWPGYKKLTRFINFYEDVYAVQDEIKKLKGLRDDLFIDTIEGIVKKRQELARLPE